MISTFWRVNKVRSMSKDWSIIFPSIFYFQCEVVQSRSYWCRLDDSTSYINWRSLNFVLRPSIIHAAKFSQDMFWNQLHMSTEKGVEGWSVWERNLFNGCIQKRITSHSLSLLTRMLYISKLSRTPWLCHYHPLADVLWTHAASYDVHGVITWL
jgi:hypothetical protein